MSDTSRLSENDEEELEFKFERNYYEGESYDSPQVTEFINKLQEHIKWQYRKIDKLRRKLIEWKKKERLLPEKQFIDRETQTDSLENCTKPVCLDNWSTGNSENRESIVDQVKEAAESALQQTGFAYEETSGLYYDYNTGYYYDATQGLYYDGNSGIYYYYEEASKSYKFHSQVQVTKNEAAIRQKKIEKKSKRKARKANKVSNEINALISGLSKISIERYKQQATDLAKTYPPCMRIIVKETDLPKLKVGSLFVVAYTGGSMGREGDHSVLIPDINISKHHGRFQYDEDKKQYQIVDLGSRNGTLLNGKRLSVAKQESDPSEIIHGSIIQVGNTKLLCHIHNGYETCGYCEPGLVQQSSIVEGSVSSNKKDQHRSELRRLKHKFGVEKSNVSSASQVAVGYQDRAQARRVFVGSSNHHAKTEQSSIDASINKDNKGFKLLSKMGWSEGQSLGKGGDGRTDPVPLVSNHNKVGLGAAEPEYSNFEVDPCSEKKQAVWRKTQQRYQEIPD